MNNTKTTSKVNMENLLSRISSYNKEADFDLVKKAFEFAEKCHKGQKRKNGEDYFTHPYNVVTKLIEIRMDEKTIAAGLLHDVIEDCGVTEESIEQLFGSEVAGLVAGVTKLGEIDFQVSGEDDTQQKGDPKRTKKIESLRKLFLAMAEDIRVVLIKLSDRLHNLETLDALDKGDQERIAEETIDIYAPLADRLGMGVLKARLEDLAFKYLLPKEYDDTVRATKEVLKEKEVFLKKMTEDLEKILKEEDIVGDIEGRAKHLYSIYKKLASKEELSKIYDLMAIRIIVPTTSDCYKTLGAIHARYKPLIYRIKDYIAVPKPNGYQSLHTTVFGLDGKIIEIQIRTKKMHEEAEKGVAAHWQYDEQKGTDSHKEGGSSFAPKDKMGWIKELLEWQNEAKSSEEFIEGLKIDIFKDRIFVFSPKGDVFDLPEGATPVDFAYAVHSDIGDRLMGAKVNGKMLAIDHPLENRSIVEIITQKNSKGPKRDWLRFVITSKARNRIRSCLNKKEY